MGANSDPIPGFRIPVSLAFAALALCLPAAPAAHPQGTSKVALHLLDPDSLRVTVDVNRDDLAYAVGVSVNVKDEPGKRGEDARLYQDRSANYLNGRVRIQVDGAPVALHITQWKAGGQGLADGYGNDTSAYLRDNHVFTLAGHLPNPRRTLLVDVQLFAELEVQPISEVSVFWKDSLLERHWLGTNQNLRFPLHPDSLAARLAARQKGPGTAVPGTEHPFIRFLGHGFVHIVPLGLDHILFVLGLFFFSTQLRPLFLQVTAFTVAHSLTLGLSLAGTISLSPRIVEPLIALSIAVVGAENIFLRRPNSWRWLIVFGFGLIHGLGFAGALRELGLPPVGFWAGLAGFNVGVELGQITVIAAAFAVTGPFWKRPWYFRRIAVPVSIVITVTALYWVVVRIWG